MSNNTASARILVVEDDRDLREAIVDTLVMARMHVREADSGEAALQALEADARVDLIVSDVNMGAMSGHDLLRIVKTRFPAVPVLLTTAYASIADSVTAIKDGAVDYLVKPFEPEQLLSVVRGVAGPRLCSGSEPVAESRASRELLRLAQRIAMTDSTALLLGESGTGKEVLAQYIHRHSPRKDGPFIAVNCAAIPENMLEATLFGYEKGAFTGAYTAAPGKFEQANGGTILLDEISEMDLSLQAKLLRVLQEREVERLGAKRVIQLDVRVIATSNRDMRREVEVGNFREDLYFRLCVLPLQWTPLRERREDILPLAERLLARHADKQHRGAVTLTESARNALLHHDWPGNVRELDNVMQRALILQSGTCIQAHDLGLSLTQSTRSLLRHPPSPDRVYSPNMSAMEPSVEEAVNNDALLGDDLRKHEFDIIVKTLRQERGSKKHTAEKLGISPRTLRYKLARLREEGYDLEAALA